MFCSASFNALCGVGLPRPNFQRLIDYVEPEQEEELEVEKELKVEEEVKVATKLVWRRQPLSTDFPLSEMRMRCPGAYVLATVVGVDPQTGQPIAQGVTYHRTLLTAHCRPHPSVSRRPKLMDICQERLSRECSAKRKVVWQRPSISRGRVPRRVRAQMDFAKQKAKEGKPLDRAPVHHTGSRTEKVEEETRKLTHDKATSVASFISTSIANRSAAENTPIKESFRKNDSLTGSAYALDLELRRVLTKYRVSASQLSKRLHRLVLHELPDSQVEEGSTPIPTSRKASDHRRASGTTTLQPKTRNARVDESPQAVDSSDSKSSSLATDSQEIHELSTAAGLTAAFVRRHELFRILVRKR
ncbi:uncharacterized protein LOC26536308 [Drosophila yakuba]|uniref:Uncharacterized protein n=1 Tax=Drosophila yakuba TaxID=7245 RepID=A0A0R1EEK4_DROYA|nr:uncharacterized protein LOC26536308 [Drosophila yakuba]KRK05650.1 uncharacterized protein Dyak_GE29127 [Drosophila yakuba]